MCYLRDVTSAVDGSQCYCAILVDKEGDLNIVFSDPEQWHAISTFTRLFGYRHRHDDMCGYCCAFPRHNWSKTRCGKCHAVRYCGRECQVAHWPEHRPVCVAQAALAALDLGGGGAAAAEPAV